MPASRKTPSLAQLIRRSPVLDASSRRQWLAVLPHLTDDDRERLRELLVGSGEDNLTPQPPLRRGEGEQAEPR